MSDSLKKILIKKEADGYLTCDLPVTKEKWLDIIRNRTVTTPQSLRVLLSFYYMLGHKASCTQCEEEYGLPSATYNIGISNYGKAVCNFLNYFIILDESGKQRYWPVTMGKGKEIKIGGKIQFEWQLRKELVEAIEEYVIGDAIESYNKDFDLYYYIERDGSFYNEKYKWQAVKWFQDNWDITAMDFPQMLEKALSKTENLLNSRSNYARGMIGELAYAAPYEVKQMFDILYDESKLLEERVTEFIKGAEKVRSTYNPQKWKSHFQSTNAVSVYLWLRNPDKYYIYKYGEYKEVDEKLGLGYDIKRNGEPSEMVKGFDMYDSINKSILANKTTKELIESRVCSDPTCYKDPKLKTTTVDFGYYVSRRYRSIKNSLYSKSTTTMNPFLSKAKTILEIKKNIILQGAPGTGKTYNTAALALSIIDGIVPDSHEQVMERYNKLYDERRIGFATFHQSMDYEDFVEGIKPTNTGDTVSYSIEPGIFKQMCLSAKTASEVAASGTENLLSELNENPTIWKVSLEGTGDNPTRRDCMKNGHIRIGWSEYGDIDFTEDNPKVTEGKYILKAFQNDMKIGDIVVSCWSANETDAIGIVTGDYEYRTEGGQLPRYRDVHWIVKDVCHDIRSINNNKRMTLGTVYRLSTSLNDIIDVIKQYAPSQPTIIDHIEKPYVLIIDEINRGNVSKVFGELITLIEKDKRIDSEHPVSVILPYSKEHFGVPSNLYIIGKMNTTDRSTGTIDYALRRRFAFLTVPSEKKHIDNELGKNLFDSVKKFIYKFRFADMDIEDLMVGHSYFMADDEENLKLKVEYEIIPLIKEYIKDGILRVNREEQNKYFDAWLSLETLKDNDNNNGTSED